MFEPGTLWPQVRERTQQATRSGALESIRTRRVVIEDGGVRFLVSVVEALEHKRRISVPQGRKLRSPFLPYEKELFVAEASETHLILLNKFNVVEHHMLIVTRELEEQQSWLTLRDFEAMWNVLNEFDGLGFYNAGRVAGASQRHKHLQAVPLPLGDGPERVPVEPLVLGADEPGHVRTSPELVFAHALASLRWDRTRDARRSAEDSSDLYRKMCRALDIDGVSTPYNLLMTREWMLLVPRSREMFGTISVNALGFAGSILVRNDEELELVRRGGPWKLLRYVSRPAPSSSS